MLHKDLTQQPPIHDQFHILSFNLHTKLHNINIFLMSPFLLCLQNPREHVC